MKETKVKRTDAEKELQKRFPANSMASFKVRPDWQLADWYANHILGDKSLKVTIVK